MMEISFPGGAAVDAHFKGFTVHTDQPVKAGGEDSGPAPFDLFLASIATCAGYYVLEFCERRDIPTDGIGVDMRTTRNPESRRFEEIEIAIRLPSTFPEKYEKAVVQAANACSVKKHLEHGPTFKTFTTR